MRSVEWYSAHGDQQAGPMTAAKLKQLADEGALRPDDLVWREGMQQWVAAREVRGLFTETASEAEPEAARPVEHPADDAQAVGPMPAAAPGLVAVPGEPPADGVGPRRLRHVFDVVLDAARTQFTAQFVGSTSRIFLACGYYCLYVAMAAGLAVSLTLGIKTGSLDPVLPAAGYLLALAVLQYLSGRFSVALERLNRTTAGNVCTTVFLDAFALLTMVGGLAIVLGSAVLAVRSDAYWLILSGVLLFIVCEYLAFVSLNPETLSISVRAQSAAAQEAIGVLSFLLKAQLRLAPVAFGAGVVYGTLRLFYAGYLVVMPPGGRDEVLALLGAETLARLEAAADPESAEMLLGVWPAAVTASTAMRWVMAFAALPVAAYFVFLVCHLLIDVVRAVLCIPGKLNTPTGSTPQQREEKAGGRGSDDGD